MKHTSNKIEKKKEVDWGQATVDALNRAEHPAPLNPGKDYDRELEDALGEDKEA